MIVDPSSIFVPPTKDMRVGPSGMEQSLPTTRASLSKIPGDHICNDMTHMWGWRDVPLPLAALRCLWVYTDNRNDITHHSHINVCNKGRVLNFLAQQEMVLGKCDM
jgi:hypothetical protein